MSKVRTAMSVSLDGFVGSLGPYLLAWAYRWSG